MQLCLDLDFFCVLFLLVLEEQSSLFNLCLAHLEFFVELTEGLLVSLSSLSKLLFLLVALEI